ncbi:MAG: cytochrome b [Saprospiraceae bacterium]|nr:cytochrome b [Saprospiraceae bacterium]
MQTGLLHLHSFVAYILLAVLVIAIVVNALAGFQGKPYGETNRKLSLYGLIATHLQVLIGLILYFVSPKGMSALSGEAMKVSGIRFYVLEHPLMMILAAILITIGYSKSKKANESKRKFNSMLVYYVIGLIFILSRLPWDAWLG